MCERLKWPPRWWWQRRRHNSQTMASRSFQQRLIDSLLNPTVRELYFLLRGNHFDLLTHVYFWFSFGQESYSVYKLPTKINWFFIERWLIWAMIWLRGWSSIKVTGLTNLREAKWSDSSAFQAFMCPAESTYGLIKTNLLVPEDTTITQTKSRVDPSRDNRVSSVTSNEDGQTDRRMAFQLYIVDSNSHLLSVK